MNFIAMHMKHDSCFAVRINGKYKVYELERLAKQRYFSLFKASKDELKELSFNFHNVITKDFGKDIIFDKMIYCDRGGKFITSIKEAFLDKFFDTTNLEVVQFDSHHFAHAACAIYQSDYKNQDSLIISIDGSGILKTGRRKYSHECFSIYLYEQSNITQIYSGKDHYGSIYSRVGFKVKEIDNRKGYLTFSGKLMGLAAYGKVDKTSLSYELVNNLYDNYKIEAPNRLKSMRYLDETWGIHEEYVNNHSWDLSACNQFILEEKVIEKIMPYLEKYPNHKICLTGGVALNVVLNKKISDLAKRPVFVPSNPNDCGQALGLLLLETKEFVGDSLVYGGFEISGNLDSYIESYKSYKPSMEELVNIINDGKIIGVAHGGSENGPRALGNRSIICDPSYAEMKDILNAKVKHREWFRPFAPFVRKDRCNKYFEFDGDSPFMSFAVNVREEYKDKLPSITHVDGTARVQTVTEDSHKFFYDLLTEFEKQTGKGVLLNTSFNIKGNPIINDIDDMFEVLETTDIDHILVNGYLFSKKKDK